MSGSGIALRGIVERCDPLLRAISEEQAGTAVNPGKWSPKEIVGHLIDSASNNHQRFVRAQLGRTQPFDGYAQDDWVAVQQYSTAPWPALVDLWASFNLHLAHVMDRTSLTELERLRPDLQLNALAFRAAPGPVTLSWFMQDYLEHLKHHLRQIDPAMVSE